MNLSNIITGIDISKNKLDIHIHPLGHHKVFENNVQAIDQILDFLRLHNVTKVGLEATGGYEKLCAYTLLRHGFEAVVLKVNRKIDVAVNKYLKFVWAYLFTAMLLLYRSSFRAILLSKQSTFSY